MAAEEHYVEIQTTEHVLMMGDEPVGTLMVTEPHRAATRAALQGAGYMVEEMREQDEPEEPEESTPEPAGERIDLEGGTCTVQEHLPCDINLGISVAADVSRDLGLPIHGTLARIQARGYTSSDEARHVLQAWSEQVRSAPGADQEQLDWADVVVSEVFGQEPETAPEG